MATDFCRDTTGPFLTTDNAALGDARGFRIDGLALIARFAGEEQSVGTLPTSEDAAELRREGEVWIVLVGADGSLIGERMVAVS